jgi:hypothetical protein
MNQSGWQAVASFTPGGPLHTLDTAVADAGVPSERFQSDAAGRALLLPIGPLAAGTIPGIAVAGAPPEVTEVLLLDPADGPSARSLLAALGERARLVAVALPHDADPTGLLPEAGGVTVAAGSGSPVAYGLFRAADPRTLDLQGTAGEPKLGEDADVLEQRSKWFQAREGRGD